MNPSDTAPSTPQGQVTQTLSALEALEKDHRWLRASEPQRAVLKRIAMQRDRLAQARKAREQARALGQPETVIRPDAPLSERMLAFAKLHPFATTAMAGVALVLGPRRLIRYGAWVLPLVRRWKR